MSDLLRVLDSDPQELEVHPLADIFPMMSQDELNDLAGDIRANGLQIPILLDSSGRVLLDGRNRLRACQIAQIAPVFERAAKDADPLALIISLNVKRRNLSAGQRAIAAADAWYQAEAAGRVLKHGGDRTSGKSTHLIADPREYFATAFGSNDKYIRMARSLLIDDPPAAESVRNGADLQEAHQALISRLGSQKAKDNRLRELERDRPDLAEKIKAGELKIDVAIEQAKADAEELKKQRWAVTVNLIDAVTIADRDVDVVDDVVRLFDATVEEGKGLPKISAMRLRRAADYFNALAQAWNEEDAQ